MVHAKGTGHRHADRRRQEETDGRREVIQVPQEGALVEGLPREDNGASGKSNRGYANGATHGLSVED